MTPEETARFDRLEAKIDEMNDKLFMDNGETSLQSRVNRNTNTNKLLLWLLAPIAIGAIGFIFRLIQAQIGS